MLESPSWSFSASPTVLISPMSDPSTMTNVFGPFLSTEAVVPDSFELALVQTVIVPNLKKAIFTREVSKFGNVPKAVKSIVVNFGDEGLSLIVDEILPAITDCYLHSPTDSSNNYQDLYLNAISSLPSRIRDDVLVEIVHKFAQSSDYRLRVLAVHTVPLVRRHCSVTAVFKDLAADELPVVRAEATSLLPNCNFDTDVIEEVVTKSARDLDFRVRNAAAYVFGNVAPRMLTLYLELLTNSATMEKALNSFVPVAEANGLEPLSAAFSTAIRSYPDKCAKVLVECAGRIDVSQHRLIFRCAKKMRHIPEMVERLYDLSAPFETKMPFLEFFVVSRMRNWREKALYAKQAVLFVQDLGSAMMDIAVDFASDENATVRDESVKIFLAIYQLHQNLADSISAVLQRTWQMRIVLAKLISEAGLPVAFWEAAKQLSTDSVELVRNCLANGVRGTPHFDVFFKD